MINKAPIKKAARYTYSHHLKNAYQGVHNRYGKTFKCKNGTVINRPNHGLAHSLRKVKYVEPVLDYLQKHGIEQQQYQFNDTEILAIQLSLLFSVVGREDEAGFRNSPEAYQSYLNNSANIFESYCVNNNLLDPATIQRFKKIIQAKHDAEDPDPARKVVFMCHELDLMRCFPTSAYKAHLENLKAIGKPNRAFTQLILYVQSCIEATGDCLKTKFYPSLGRTLKSMSNLSLKLSTQTPWFYHQARNEEQFIQCSTSVEACLEALDTVAKPRDFSIREESNPNNREQQALESLKLIKNTEAAMRLIHFKPDDEDNFSFEMNMLCDPKHFRPVREAHRDINPDNRLHYIDQLTGITLQRHYKEYIPLEEQKEVNKTPDYTEHLNQNLNRTNEHQHFRALRFRQISREADRGKPKNTIFTKKIAFSLLRPDGRCKHFKGKTFERFKYFPVGMLYDTNKMHLKGHRYVWDTDVCSSSRFWTGDKATGKKRDVDAYCKPTISRGRGTLIEKLKNRLREESLLNKEPGVRNEMLLGASVPSLKALFATENTLVKRLNTLVCSYRIYQDYGLTLPILIIDGVNAPHIYTAGMMQKDLMVLFREKKVKNILSAFNEMLPIEQQKSEKSFVEGILRHLNMPILFPMDDKTIANQTPLSKKIFKMTPLYWSYEFFKTTTLLIFTMIAASLLLTYACLASVVTAGLALVFNLKKGLNIAFYPLEKIASGLIYPSRKKPDEIPYENMDSIARQVDSFEIPGKKIKLERVTFEPKSQLDKSASEKRHIVYINGKDILWADRDWQHRMQRDASDLDCKVHSFNMPGMGNSAGSTVHFQDLTDIAYLYVKKLIGDGVSPSDIMIKGHSLGAAVATMVTARLHEEDSKVRLFNQRSFSQMENVFLARVKNIQFGSAILRPIVKLFLYLSGWEVNAAQAWHKIPDEYKEYVAIQGKGNDKSEKRYDGVISDFAALHNDDQVKTNRKNYKHALRKLQGNGATAYAQQELARVKRRKLVKTNNNMNQMQRPSGLAVGSHNLDLSDLKLRGARDKNGADFFKSYYQSNPSVNQITFKVFEHLNLKNMDETRESVSTVLEYLFGKEQHRDVIEEAKNNLYQLCQFDSPQIC